MVSQHSSAMYNINNQCLRYKTNFNENNSRFLDVFSLVFSTIFLEPGSQTNDNNQSETEHASDEEQDSSAALTLFQRIHRTQQALVANGQDLAKVIAELRDNCVLRLPGKPHPKKINAEIAAELVDFCKHSTIKVTCPNSHSALLSCEHQSTYVPSGSNGYFSGT